MILRNNLSLNQGYHGIASSESEDAYLNEYDEKLKKYHHYVLSYLLFYLFPLLPLFRWLDKLSIDVATYGSCDNHPDWVDAQKPDQKGG